MLTRLPSAPETLRVLIVADNLLARTGLAALLSTDDDIRISGQVALTAELADEMTLYAPDVLLCDLGWQPSDHLDTLAALIESGVPVLALLPDDTDAAAVLRVIAAGTCYGVLLNERDGDALRLALLTLAGGLVALDPALTDALVPALSLDDALPAEPLTPREDEVLQLLAQGLTNKAIAQRLGITDHTVKFHVTAILSKLHAQSRTDAVIKATRAGLIIL